MPDVIALIPARSGSKRIPGKNVRLLGGHPLIAYTIHAAKQSGVFSGVFVSTDSPDYAAIARRYGAEVIDRPVEYAADDSPDIQWVRHALGIVSADCFALLRPTSPFRTAGTIVRAWYEFGNHGEACDSIRAVERAKQHPGKMWTLPLGTGGAMQPYLEGVYRAAHARAPYHSAPTQGLPEVWAQNASLEIAWSRNVTRDGTISGRRVWPFITVGREGFDLNTEDDWLIAQELTALLPALTAETTNRSADAVRTA